jgi:hypothetical protein
VRIAVSLAVTIAVLAVAPAAWAAFPGRNGQIVLMSEVPSEHCDSDSGLGGCPTVALRLLDPRTGVRSPLETCVDPDQCGERYPAWSPDGRWVAFSHFGTVLVVRADGTGLRRVSSGEHPAWSPDGRRLVFSRTRPGGATDLWIAGVDGSGERRLTYRGGEDPAWSTRGQIAFVRYREQPLLQQIYVMDADGGRPRRVRRDGHEPDWSPHGSKLVYSRAFDGHGLVVSDADGRHPRALTRRGESPAWSPDGRRIVFAVRGWLYTVRADGIGRHRLAAAAAPAMRSAPGAASVTPATGADRGLPTRRLLEHVSRQHPAAHCTRPARTRPPIHQRHPVRRLAYARDRPRWHRVAP